jgi:hypothetical protein
MAQNQESRTSAARTPPGFRLLLNHRGEHKRALPATDEWRAWVATRALAEEAVRGTGKGGPLWDTTGSRLSAWPQSERGETCLSNLAHRWLLSHAFAVGSEQMTAHLKHNVSIGA